MKKNLYYRTVFRRKNIVKEFLSDVFFTGASYPRLLLEVFIRKNFGERYFSFASVITVSVVLAIFPAGVKQIMSLMSGYGSYGGYGGGGSSSDFWSKYATWYLFLIAFVYYGFKRRQEVKRNPSVFDFERFSLHTGDLHPSLSNLQIFGSATPRQVEIIYEPGLFFIIGIVLILMGQKLGALLLLSSICYSLSYWGAYRRGDEFIMDKIDEMILNEEMENAFVHDMSTDKTRGVRFYAKKPNGEELRRKVSEAIIENSPEDVGVAR